MKFWQTEEKPSTAILKNLDFRVKSALRMVEGILKGSMSDEAPAPLERRFEIRKRRRQFITGGSLLQENSDLETQEEDFMEAERTQEVDKQVSKTSHGEQSKSSPARIPSMSEASKNS